MQLPDEKKSFDQLLQDVHASAAMPDDTSDVLPDQPKVEQTDANSVLNEIERTSAQTLSKSPNATREQTLFNDASASGRPQPALTGTELATSTTIKRPNTFTSKIPGDSAGPNARHAPGFSDLDQLLSQKGPLGSGTKLRMPDDQLFAYDSADLQPSAMSQLQKLGTLIKRNPTRDLQRRGLHRFVRPARIQSRFEPTPRRQREAISGQAMGIDPAQIDDARISAQANFCVSP